MWITTGRRSAICRSPITTRCSIRPVPDITGRVLEALSTACGLGPDHPAVRRGVAYLLRTQEQDGSWYGRWGVDYIYGTFLALRGLRAAGVRRARGACSARRRMAAIDSECRRRLGRELRQLRPRRVLPGREHGIANGLGDSGPDRGRRLDQLERAEGHRVSARTQREDGSWKEELATGTGFPRVFYLTYHMYQQAFPLLALSAFLKGRNGASGGNGAGSLPLGESS